MLNTSIFATFEDAFWHLLSRPDILKIYVLTFVLAISAPFAVAYGTRLWRKFRAWWLIVPPIGQKVKPKSVSDDDEIESEKAFFNGGFFNPSLIENLYPLPPLEDVEYSNICEEDINDEHMADEKIRKDDSALSDFSRSVAREVAQSMATAAHNKIDMKGGGICPFTGICSGNNNSEVVEETDNPDYTTDEKKDEEFDEEEEEIAKLLGKSDKRRKIKKTRFEEPKWKIKPPPHPPDPETMEAFQKMSEQGLHGKLATARLRATSQQLQAKMTEEEKLKEREVQQQQLAQIFELMQKNSDNFGISKQEELAEQMRMYSV